MNLNQVTFTVNDMPTAIVFYVKMGFTLIVDTPHYARFECPEGASSFSLSLDQKKTKSSSTVIYFEHEKLDELVDELIQKGIKVDQMPTDQNYLWREAILFDPSGNKVKLYWAGKNRLNPPWRVDA